MGCVHSRLATTRRTTWTSSGLVVDRPVWCRVLPVREATDVPHGCATRELRCENLGIAGSTAHESLAAVTAHRPQSTAPGTSTTQERSANEQKKGTK